MNRIAVFCGSSTGSKSIFGQAAKKLGQKLSDTNIELVYGGAKIGLMGMVAQATLDAGGKVIGVLPHFLGDKEIVHEELTELILVDTMHERKAKMYDLSDGAIALAGGFGTLDELFECLTWSQLKLYNKPIGLLNTDGYYDGLLVCIDSMVKNGFLQAAYRDMLIVDECVDSLLERMGATIV